METVKLFPVRLYLAAKLLRYREDGQALVEYALILSLVAIGAVAILGQIGGNVQNIFSSINSDL